MPVRRLDGYIREQIGHPERIRVIKIDVEGFEFPVLKGLHEFFTRGAVRPLIVVEIKPWELVKLGHTMTDLETYMRSFGYEAYDMIDERRRVDLQSMTDMDVVVFRAGEAHSS